MIFSALSPLLPSYFSEAGGNDDENAATKPAEKVVSDLASRIDQIKKNCSLKFKLEKVSLIEKNVRKNEQNFN